MVEPGFKFSFLNLNIVISKLKYKTQNLKLRKAIKTIQIVMKQGVYILR